MRVKAILFINLHAPLVNNRKRMTQIYIFVKYRAYVLILYMCCFCKNYISQRLVKVLWLWAKFYTITWHIYVSCVC